MRELPPGDRPKDWVDSPEGSAAGVEATAPTDAEAAAEVPAGSVPQRYRVEFTASQEYVDLLERRKYGARRARESAVPESAVPESAVPESAVPESAAVKANSVESKKRTHVTRRSGSAAVRREVLERDGRRCAFVDATGARCRETRFLEFHHRHAHAKGGEPSAGNLSVWCQAHNGLVRRSPLTTEGGCSITLAARYLLEVTPRDFVLKLTPSFVSRCGLGGDFRANIARRRIKHSVTTPHAPEKENFLAAFASWRPWR